MQSKRHVKRFFVFCTGVCLHVCVCVHIQLCGGKKNSTPEGYPFVLISLMKFVERDGQRAFLFLSGRRSCVSDYKTPAFLHQTGGQRGYKNLQQTALPLPNSPVKTIVWCTLSYLPGPVYPLLCLLVRICENSKVEEKRSHPPSTLHLN